MNLYIMRHGETDWNKQGKLQGSVDIPLNDFGIELAEKTRDGFQREGITFDKVFSSPYIRAHKTAEIIVGVADIPIDVQPDIREMNFGVHEGACVRDLRTNPAYARLSKCFDDPLHYEPEGDGESYEEIFARIGRFLTEQILPLEGQYENVLVVCHGGVLRAFISIIKKMQLEDFWTISQPNCSVNLARVHGGRIEMVEENHLYYEFQADEKRGFV